MKKFNCQFFIILTLISIILPKCIIKATNLDGTNSVVYTTHHHVFRNMESAQGFVSITQGMTTLQGAHIFLDTPFPISGPIDLRTTGSITLNRDIQLASNVTFSTGGTIASDGHTLHLLSDITIPMRNTIRCHGSMCIDGGGNTLHLENDAHIFVDTNTSLTLRNMMIKATRMYPGKPAIQASTTLSHITLDNVVVDLSDDFWIKTGTFFFSHDVIFTGTNALLYYSPAPSYISQNSCLYFDHGTTFSYCPATNRSDLLSLFDDSSSLHFNGCTLRTTNTGLTLSQGKVFIENTVNLNTNSTFLFNTIQNITSQAYGTNVYAVAWSPNQKYLAVGGRAPVLFGGISNNHEIQIYKFDGNNLIPLASADYGTFVHIMYWSPDGHYLFVGGDSPINTFEIQVYAFDESSLQYICGYDNTSTWTDLSVSPDGHHIAVFRRGDSLKVLYFDGINLTLITSVAISDLDPAVLEWSPDGIFLAMGAADIFGAGTADIAVYKFKNNTLTLAASYNTGGNVKALAWSPNGTYLFSGDIIGGLVRIFEFTGSELTLIDSTTYGTSPWGCPSPWSIDGQYIFIGGQDGTDGNELHIYRFDGSTLTKYLSLNDGAFIRAVALSPDGQYFAYGGEGDPSNPTHVFVKKLVYQGASPEPYNPIQNAQLELGPNLSTNILSGARFLLQGNLVHSPD